MVVVYTFNGDTKAAEFDKDEVIIGRPSSSKGMPDLDLRPDKNVSRRHARLWREDNTYWVEDLGSQLGVLVNGLRRKKQQLKFGDRIQIGKTVLQIAPSNTRELDGGKE